MGLREFSVERSPMQLCWKVMRRFIPPGHLLLGRISLTSCDFSSLIVSPPAFTSVDDQTDSPQWETICGGVRGWHH